MKAKLDSGKAVEQITNLRIINEKVKDHQGFVFYNFIIKK